MAAEVMERLGYGRSPPQLQLYVVAAEVMVWLGNRANK
jgi:hypothetical protein